MYFTVHKKEGKHWGALGQIENDKWKMKKRLFYL